MCRQFNITVHPSSGLVPNSVIKNQNRRTLAATLYSLHLEQTKEEVYSLVEKKKQLLCSSHKMHVMGKKHK